MGAAAGCGKTPALNAGAGVMSARLVQLNEDAAAEFALDRKIFQQRLTGTSVRNIADDLRCDMERVEAGLLRMCGAVTPEVRQRTVQLELERLDAMQKVQHEAVAKGGISASMLSLKIMEHRARLLGLYPPTRSDDVLGNIMADKDTSTDRIERLLDEIAGVSQTTIEGEAVEVSDKGEKNG
jgi:hypothetical protein